MFNFFSCSLLVFRVCRIDAANGLLFLLDVVIVFFGV